MIVYLVKNLKQHKKMDKKIVNKKNKMNFIIKYKVIENKIDR
jgi:hypothetical protein